MMRAWCATLVVVFACLAATKASAQDDPSYRVGRWMVTPFQSGGKFSSCIAVVPAQKGGAMGLRLSADRQWQLLVVDADAPWAKLADVTVSWSIGNDVRASDAYVRRGTAYIRLTNASAQIAEFGRSRNASIVVERTSYAVALDGLDAAVAELRRCVDAEGEPAAQATPAPQQPPPGFDKEYKVGRWSIDRYRDNSGKLLYCIASQPAINDMFHALRLTVAGNWTMVLFGHSTARAKGATFSFAYRVDDRPQRNAFGQKSADDLLNLDIGDSQQVLDELRNGRSLHLLIDRVELTFSLEGSSAAIAEVERCAGQRPRPAPVAPAPPPAQAPALPTETPSSHR